MAERVRRKRGDHWFRPQGPAFAVALLLLVVAGGTIGYHLTEGWSFWHGFYVTILGITTVDLPAFSPRAGSSSRSSLLFAGVGAALYTFTLLATVVVEGGLPKRLQRRKYERMLDQLKDHFIVCGYGRIGSIVAGQLQRQTRAVRRHRARSCRLQTAMDDGALAVEADASREDVLKRVGIDARAA